MNISTWTDEQLQEHIATWDALRKSVITTLDLTYTITTKQFAWQGTGCVVSYEGSEIELTWTQAERFEQWFYQRTSTTSDERNTHFQGFAKIEWEKIEAYIRTYGFIPEGERMRAEFLPPLYDLLAQCAYDLMEHIMLYAPAVTVPDLTEWPEYEEK